jgi:hypothetical protein
MTESTFIQEVQNELSGSGSLPIVLEEKEIKRIILQSSRWFFENYSAAVEPQHYVIEKKDFNNPQFKKTRTLLLPECIVSVYNVKEINGVGRLGNIDRDFAEDRLIASEIFLSSFHGDDLVMRTAQYQYFDLAKAFFLEQIAYDYNRNTHKLRILGRDPKFDVYIEGYSKIAIDKLYDDYYFLRFIVGKAKISLANILGMYPFPLPGNVQVNFADLKSDGQTEVEWVLQKIDEENVADWFFMYH